MRKKTLNTRKNQKKNLCMGYDQKVAMKNNYIND